MSTLGLGAAAYFPNKHNLGYPASIVLIYTKLSDFTEHTTNLTLPCITGSCLLS